MVAYFLNGKYESKKLIQSSFDSNYITLECVDGAVYLSINDDTYPLELPKDLLNGSSEHSIRLFLDFLAGTYRVFREGIIADIKNKLF